MIIDDILTRFEQVIEGESEAKYSGALKVRDARDFAEQAGRGWHGAAFIDVPTLPTYTTAFGQPGKAEFTIEVEVAIGWEARKSLKEELPQALHTEARVRHALETASGWPSECNAPIFVRGELQRPVPGDPSLWAIVGLYAVTYLDTYPETT